jgi:malonate transporter and related proteins
MVDVLNLALPYFSVIFIGFASGKVRGRPDAGLAWMSFFLISLPALLFGITSRTPFAELDNPPRRTRETVTRIAAQIDAV